MSREGFQSYDLPRSGALGPVTPDPSDQRIRIEAALRDVGLTKQADRYHSCMRSRHVRLRPDGAPAIILHHCDSHLCNYCHQHRHRRTMEAARYAVRDSARCILMTLTGRGSWDCPGKALDELGLSLSYLVRHPEWRRRVVGAMAVFECEWKREAGRLHPHFHLLADVPNYWENGTAGPNPEDVSPDTTCGLSPGKGYRRMFCASCIRKKVDIRCPRSCKTSDGGTIKGAGGFTSTRKDGRACKICDGAGRVPNPRRGCGRGYGLRDVWRECSARAARDMGAEGSDAALGAYIVHQRLVDSTEAGVREAIKYVTKTWSVPTDKLGQLALGLHNRQRVRWLGGWYGSNNAPDADPSDGLDVDIQSLYDHARDEGMVRALRARDEMAVAEAFHAKPPSWAAGQLRLLAKGEAHRRVAADGQEAARLHRKLWFHLQSKNKRGSP